MHGPGKYDDVCTMVREETNADAAIVIIIGGNRGQGFSMQATDPAYLAVLPDVLDMIAREVRKDYKAQTQ